MHRHQTTLYTRSVHNPTIATWNAEISSDCSDKGVTASMEDTPFIGAHESLE